MISSKPPIWHYSVRSRRAEIGSWLMVHEKAVARCNSVSLSEPKKTSPLIAPKSRTIGAKRVLDAGTKPTNGICPIVRDDHLRHRPGPRRTSRHVAGNLVCYTRTLTFWVGHEIDGPGNASCRSPLS